MKQSKTRNNLQSHVISSSGTNNNKQNRVVVGQPYIAFKQQYLGASHLTTKAGGARSKFESSERASQVY